MRVVHKWHKSSDRDLKQVAESLAYNCWKFALTSVRGLQDEKFYFTSKAQGMAVTTEMLIFLMQVTDRLIYDAMEPEDRAQFIGAMAYRFLDILLDNYQDLGAGESMPDRTGLVGLINERSNDYAAFSYGEEGPSYHFLRYFGERVGAIMGGDQDNRWVSDQMMEIEAPDVIAKLKKSIGGIVGIDLD
jgi:hypothetical protein